MIISENGKLATAELSGMMDSLYRFGAGVDHNDKLLLTTAFSVDAVVDFGPCGRAMGLNFPVLTGVETIVGFLGAASETQTTSHTITNGRGTFDGHIGSVRVLVDATHLPRADHSRRCQMMNWYEADLVMSDDLWRIRRLVISNVWFSGDVNVLIGK